MPLQCPDYIKSAFLLHWMPACMHAYMHSTQPQTYTSSGEIQA